MALYFNRWVAFAQLTVFCISQQHPWGHMVTPCSFNLPYVERDIFADPKLNPIDQRQTNEMGCGSLCPASMGLNVIYSNNLLHRWTFNGIMLNYLNRTDHNTEDWPFCISTYSSLSNKSQVLTLLKHYSTEYHSVFCIGLLCTHLCLKEQVVFGQTDICP